MTVLVAALTLTAAACGGTATTTTTTTDGGARGGRPVFSTEYPFAVSYPSEWTTELDSLGTVVIFLSPLLDAGDTFSENVNVVVESLRGSALSLDEYMDLTMEVLDEVIVGFSLADEGATTLGGRPAHFIEYTGTEPTVGLSLTWLQVIAIHDGNAYVVTYTGDRDYAEFRDTALRMIETWEWR
jgi:hypothetical protein